MKLRFQRSIVGFLFLVLASVSCKMADGGVSENRPPENRPGPEAPLKINSSEHINKPTVLMISIDGFRYDYLQKYNPPTLNAWAREGVQAEGMVPSFPTMTFPNHVTLVTGLRPGKHGIVSNSFHDKKLGDYSIGNIASVNDSKWYRGVPVWTAAEKQGMLSAVCFWVGSEAKIGGVDPTYLKKFDDEISNAQRVDWTLEWLNLPEANRPHFIGLYFSEVDHAGHDHGPNSDDTREAVLNVDRELARLKAAIDQSPTPIQVIIVSDHGMLEVDPNRVPDLSQFTDLSQFKTSGKGAVSLFYSNDQAAIEKAYQDLKKADGPFKVYKPNELPARWHFTDPDRQGDLIVVGDPGTYLFFQKPNAPPVQPPFKTSVGTHGWDPRTKQMQGIFIANGSLFRKGMTIRPFDNVHVYPLVMDVLGLRTLEEHDGDLRVLKPILKTRKSKI